ncbi:MAG: hypothetical protein RIR69_112 [Actinomycetota bacterium]|jgi:hypothetical protein
MDSFRGNNAYDRLSALRQATPIPQHKGRKQPRLVIAGSIGLVCVLILGGFAILRLAEPRQIVEPVDQSVDEVVPPPANIDTLLDGEAYIAIAADIGTFPPSLSPGDTVQIVIAPNINSEEVARSLEERAVVREIQTPSEFSNTFVITLRAPQTVAAAVIDAEKVHLSVVDEAAS